MKTVNIDDAALRHEYFLREAYMISRTITDQLQEDDCIFKDYLTELRHTASFVNGLAMDLPLTFEVFLPIRLPVALAPSFDERQRTVQLRKPDMEHPFFFGNMLNATCMNMLLEQELQLAIDSLGSIRSKLNGSVVYDLSYRTHRYRRVPFMHEILAVDRASNGRRCLRFEFILAVLFEGPVLPLPPYYDVPIKYAWLAYGKIAVDRNTNPADWAVMVPKWQTRHIQAAERCRSVVLRTHRMLNAQQCHNYAVPGTLKLAFATAVQQIKVLQYAVTPIQKFIVLIMKQLVERNIFHVDDNYNVNGVMLNAHRQRMHIEGLIRLLDKNNTQKPTLSDFERLYNRYIYVLPRRKSRRSNSMPKSLNDAFPKTNRRNSI